MENGLREPVACRIRLDMVRDVREDHVTRRAHCRTGRGSCRLITKDCSQRQLSLLQLYRKFLTIFKG